MQSFSSGSPSGRRWQVQPIERISAETSRDGNGEKLGRAVQVKDGAGVKVRVTLGLGGMGVELGGTGVELAVGELVGDGEADGVGMTGAISMERGMAARTRKVRKLTRTARAIRARAVMSRAVKISAGSNFMILS